MPELTKDNGGPNEAAGVFSWNVPKKAVNPYLDPADVAPVSALSNLITLYAADNEQEQLRREALSDEVWERYFFNESRDPVQRELEQDRLISRAKMAREQQRFNPDLVILANVSAEPAHVSKPLLERIKFFQGQGRPKAYSRYLRETIRPCLERLERVRESQVSASFRFMASHEGLEGLLVLPEMNQEQVKRLSTLVAAHMSMCLDAACSDLFVTDNVKPEQIRQSWEKVAVEAMRLDVIPPAFEQLRRKKRRRKPVPYDLIPGSLARMLCADWWYRKLWQMRCEWREEQLRAVCLVNKKASPYVSYEAVIHKREQRRKSLEFFQAHELVNADGDTLDMEDVVNASSSNPAHRRNEMMACVKGLELIAEMRGDCAVFYTITCPSRFHATLNNGRPNPKWTSETVRQSSDYLVDTFAAFRKAIHKAGLRWYGVRVAEPHHDGTVHWHLLCFMRKKDRRTLTALLRKFAIREDRAELGNNTGPRFKSELINQLHGLMHVRETRIIGLLFFGEQRGNAGKQGGFVVLDFFQLDKGFFGGRKQVVRFLFTVCQRVMGGAGAERQHFGAEARRIVSGSQTNKIGFAGIGKFRADLHGGEQLLAFFDQFHQGGGRLHVGVQRHFARQRTALDFFGDQRRHLAVAVKSTVRGVGLDVLKVNQCGIDRRVVAGRHLF
ncbi:replication endonuclease [Lelliottia amnigena]|nr:replication endonuclease [Lelliottia amnigena]